MSKVLVTDSYLSGIADAIREKNSSTATYKPSQMAAAISALDTSEGGSGSTVDLADLEIYIGDYSDSDALSVTTGAVNIYARQICT